MVDLMDNGKLKKIRTHNQVFTDEPNEKFMLMILGSQAKLENDNKSEHVKKGLRAKAEKGLYPCIAPIGYLNHPSRDKPGVIIKDPDRAPLVKEAFEKVGNDGWSGRDIYQWLKDVKDFKSRQGGHLGLSSIYRMLKNPFYYGEFEYPKDSGNWYQGKHEPLISKKLFDKVREQCGQRTQYKPADKDFAFTKLMKCGNCGSGISAQEKYKELSNGHTAKYIYYGCSRSQDLNCKERNIREKELIKQISSIIDEIDLEEAGLKQRLISEVKKYYKFQNIFGEGKEKLR